MKITVTYELEITNERLGEIYDDEGDTLHWYSQRMHANLKGLCDRSDQEYLVHRFVLGRDNHGEDPSSIKITHIHVTD